MPTLTAGYTIDKAELILQDTTNVRWTVAELLGWFNDGQREIVMLRPDANPQRVAHQTVAGTRQTIPATGYQLLNVVRNMGSDGTTPGRAIRKVPMDQLDSTIPEWHTATASGTTLHYMFNPLEPKVFYVYPQSGGAHRVELIYSAAPADLASVGDVQTLDDVYANALLDYVLYRAYTKDNDSAGNAQRAVGHRQAFENTLGLKAQADGAAVAANKVQG